MLGAYFCKKLIFKEYIFLSVSGESPFRFLLGFIQCCNSNAYLLNIIAPECFSSQPRLICVNYKGFCKHFFFIVLY